MDAGGEATSRLVARLRRAGLDALAADLLEAAGPLASLGAQLSYLVDPFVNGGLEAYGRLLEDPDEIQALVRRLRQEQP
jgi:hypothetical protein